MLSALLTCAPGPSGLACQSGVGLVNTVPGAGLAGASVGGFLSGSLLALVADPMASAAEGLVKTLGMFWMNVGTPQLSGQGTPVATISGDTRWIVNLVAVGCILVAAARMAVLRRGEPARAMLTGLVRLVFVTAASTVLVQAAGYLGDQWSAQLMSTAHLSTGGWSTAINVTALGGALGGGDGILLVVSLMLIFSVLIQLMLMVLRVGLVIVLTGTLPLAAAASMCEWGESWWRRHCGWLAAWLLYKPAAALVLTSAFALTRGTSLTEVLAGWMLLILSVLTLPALLKLIVPLTAALGAASPGSLALAASGAAASGAARLGGLPGIGAAVASRFRPSGSGTAASEGQEPGGDSADGAGMTPGSSAAGAAPGADPPSQPAADGPAGSATADVEAEAAGAAVGGTGDGPQGVPGQPSSPATGSANADDPAMAGRAASAAGSPARSGAAAMNHGPQGGLPAGRAAGGVPAEADAGHAGSRPSGAAGDVGDGPSPSGGTGNE